MSKAKDSKRILKVTVRRMLDDSPDTSYLGEYGKAAKSEFAIDRTHSLDCQVNNEPKEAIAKLGRIRDYVGGQKAATHEEAEVIDTAFDCLSKLQDSLYACDCGERGDMGRNEFRYFNGLVENYKGEEPENIRKYIRQDYERMESLNAGNWCYIGIRAEASVLLSANTSMSPKERAATCSHVTQTITSGGLWGIESDSDKSYFAEVEAEELSGLRTELTALGFSRRAIAKAFKDVEHREE